MQMVIYQGSFDATHWSQILIPALVSAIAALLGVLIGGAITYYNQKKERQHRRFQEQLGFYGTLLGMRMEIRAKSEVRERIRSLSRVAYDNEIKQAGNDVTAREKISKEYGKVLQYDGEQLTEELVPLYREMLAHWNKNMALAEPSTQKHYKVFVEYVEVWNRMLKMTLTAEVMWEIEHQEENL